MDKQFNKRLYQVREKLNYLQILAVYLYQHKQ